jgi:hypothetical protein
MRTKVHPVSLHPFLAKSMAETMFNDAAKRSPSVNNIQIMQISKEKQYVGDLQSEGPLDGSR